MQTGDRAARPRITARKAWGHLRTITRHKLLVARHCFAAGLVWQGLVHDLSKYSPVEFLTGARYFMGSRSPNAVEREQCGISLAWQHHKGRNKHHYEYWIDVVGNGDVTMEGKRMPVRYVVEMFCDRVAACKVYRGDRYGDRDALDYWEREHRGNGPLMHPETDALLKSMLDLLAERGEREAFAIIRERYVRGKGAPEPSALEPADTKV